MSLNLTSFDDAAWTSPWRRRCVGDKALLAFGLVVTALLLPPWPGGVLVGIAACGVLLGPAGLAPRLLWAAMLAPLAFVLIGAVSAVVAIGPAPVDAAWSWGPFWVGGDSLARAGGLLVHGLSGALAVMVLAATTPMADLIAAGRRLRIPDALLEIAALMYRFVFLLLDTAVLVREAQSARLGGPTPGMGRLAAARAQLALAGDQASTVLLRSVERARALADGLAGRGYDTALVTLPAARLRSWRFEAASVALLAAIVLLTVAASRAGLA